MRDPFSADPAREDRLILVDGLDRETGEATKERAHREGLLHRAFSAALLRGTGAGTEILLSRRAEDKYHCGGLWANSCCSHPRAGEALAEAAARRIREELGCGASGLREIGSFVYRASFPSGLWEYEYDHVLLGRCEGEPAPEPAEVSGTRWVSVPALADMLRREPALFAPWAFPVLSIVLQALTRGEGD